MKAIKNYRSSIEIDKLFAHLQQVLMQHGAKQITFDYGSDGKFMVWRSMSYVRRGSVLFV
jgi:hypothetical protein